jgi:hypothetical protein
MPIALHIFHSTMCVLTLGLWLPVYAGARRKRKTVTRYR